MLSSRNMVLALSALCLALTLLPTVIQAQYYCQNSYTNCRDCTADIYCVWCNGASTCQASGSGYCYNDQSVVPSDCPYTLTAGAIAGIVIGCLFFVACIVVLIWFIRRRRYQQVIVAQPYMAYSPPPTVIVGQPNYGQPAYQGYQGTYAQPAGYVAPQYQGGGTAYQQQP